MFTWINDGQKLTLSCNDIGFKACRVFSSIFLWELCEQPLIVDHIHAGNGCNRTCIWHIIGQKADVCDMEILLVIFVIIMVYLNSECVTSCEILRTESPFNDYRCVSHSGTDIVLHRSAYPQCLWQCLTKKTCRYVNHNSTADECQQGLGNCEFLVVDIGGSLWTTSEWLSALGHPRQIWNLDV